MPFKPGQSGNPGGRPKGIYAAVQAKCGKDGQKLINELANLAFTSEDEIVRLKACVALLERGWGKPTAPVELTGKDGAPLIVTVELDAPSEDA